MNINPNKDTYSSNQNDYSFQTSLEKGDLNKPENEIINFLKIKIKKSKVKKLKLKLQCKVFFLF